MGGLRLIGLRGTSMFDMIGQWFVFMFKVNSWVEAKLEVGGFMLGLGNSRGGLC